MNFSEEKISHRRPVDVRRYVGSFAVTTLINNFTFKGDFNLI